MNKVFGRGVLVVCGAVLLSACGNKETKEALNKSSDLARQQQYNDANEVLVEALQARETKIRNAAGNPTDQGAADALMKKVKSDSEILRLENAQIPLYLRMDRAEVATAVYTDILTGNPKDTSITDDLHDKDQVIRIGAVHILSLLSRPESIDALISATRDSDQDVRRAAVSALGEIKDPRVVPPLIAELKDPFWFARQEAAGGLGQRQDETAIKPLLDASGDPDKNVSQSAHDALVTMARAQNSVAKPDDFAARLNDQNPNVSMTAAECMAMLKDPRAIPVLLKLVNSSDPTVRLNAIKGLGESGDRSALPTLRQTLKDPDPNVRGWSIIGLGELKDEDSLMDLEHIASDDTENHDIRAAASAAADKIKASLPPLETPP